MALVGQSGCGKSTTIQLLQRFYDPLKGKINIDRKSIKDLNLKWFRNQIGVVNQVNYSETQFNQLRKIIMNPPPRPKKKIKNII